MHIPCQPNPPQKIAGIRGFFIATVYFEVAFLYRI